MTLLSLLLLFCWTISTCGDGTCKNVIHSKSSVAVSRKDLTPDQLELSYGNAGDYPLKQFLGKGASGSVYMADCKKIGIKDCVVKMFNVTSPHYNSNQTLQEVLMLQTVCGGPNVMKMFDVIKLKGHPALVLEYIHSVDANVDRTYSSLTPSEVQYFMRELLTAIAFIHKQKVIHRDIKPHNVLIDRSRRSIRLIDFGLAMFHNPELERLYWWHSWVAPEFILKGIAYDYKLDIWSFGVMFAALITRRFPMFYGRSHEGVMANIVRVLGSDDLVSYLRDIGRSPNISEPLLHLQRTKVDWKDVAKRDQNSGPYAIPEALDLINHLVR